MFNIRYLDQSDNRAMLDILRSAPVTTDTLTLFFDKEPDIFAIAEIKYSPYQYLGFFLDEKLVGFALNGYQRVRINGNMETIFTYAGMYIKPEARSKGFGYNISNFFYSQTYDKARYGYAVIMDGNKASLSLVGRRHPRFPNVPWSKIINKLHVKSIVLAWPIRPVKEYTLRPATLADIPAIITMLNEEHQDRLFGQFWSEETFREHLAKRPGLSLSDYYLAEDWSNNICGVCAAWDCSSIKRTRVVRYGRKFLPSRIGHKILEWLFRIPPLPVKDEAFKEVYLSDYAVKDRNPLTMKAFLVRIYNDYRKRGYHLMYWGSTEDDPLLKAADGFFSEEVISNIVLCATQPELLEDENLNKHLPYIDIACL